MDPRQLELARKLRKMSDAEAFDFLVNGLDDPVQRRRLVGHRPWRKQFHRPLAAAILPEVKRDGFGFAIKAFLKFMKPTALSQELWIATKDDMADRCFAGYHFVWQATPRLGKDHPALGRWRLRSGSGTIRHTNRE